MVLERKPSFLEVAKDKVQSGMYSFVGSLMSQMYTLATLIGISTYAIDSVQDLIVGFTLNNPLLIMNAILSAVLTKILAEKFTEVAIVGHLKQWTDYFSKVVNNLNVYYTHANDTVTEFFKRQDYDSVRKAIDDLVDAHGRDQDGTFQRMFSD